MEKTLRILVVDDGSSIRTLLQDVLRMSGHKVRTAENGYKALIKISKKMPDIVITDWHMPEMSGPELIKEIRYSYPGVKIILMSGDDEQDVKEAAVMSGADDFICKPFHFHNLLAKIKKLK